MRVAFKHMLWVLIEENAVTLYLHSDIVLLMKKTLWDELAQVMESADTQMRRDW